MAHGDLHAPQAREPAAVTLYGPPHPPVESADPRQASTVFFSACSTWVQFFFAPSMPASLAMPS